jgi:putative redox protein
MTVTYNGDHAFTARTTDGLTIPMEAPVGMGGHGTIPNPIQYLVASMCGCVGVKIVLALGDRGIVPDELAIAFHGTRVKTMPAFFDRVHLEITLRADADDAMVQDIVDQTIRRLCPIAAMFAECGDVTATCRIIR